MEGIGEGIVEGVGEGVKHVEHHAFAFSCLQCSMMYCLLMYHSMHLKECNTRRGNTKQLVLYISACGDTSTVYRSRSICTHAPLLMPYGAPLLMARGPPATDDIMITLACLDANSKGCASCVLWVCDDTVLLCHGVVNMWGVVCLMQTRTK